MFGPNHRGVESFIIERINDIRNELGDSWLDWYREYQATTGLESLLDLLCTPEGIGGEHQVLIDLGIEALFEVDWDVTIDNIVNGHLEDELEHQDAIVFVLEDSYGIYIPQEFANRYWDVLHGLIDDVDLSILLAGPSPDSLNWNGPEVDEDTQFWEFGTLDDENPLHDLVRPVDWDWEPIDHSNVYWEVWNQLTLDPIFISGIGDCLIVDGTSGVYLIKYDVMDLIPEYFFN